MKETTKPPKEEIKQDKKEENFNLLILNEKIDLLKSEVSENKLYLELCFVALLVVIFGYFKSDAGQSALLSGSIFGKLMVSIAIGLYVGIVYFFYSVIRFNHKNKKLIEEKMQKLE